MSASARFKINSSPSSDLGFDATHGQVLTFELENLPAPEVRSVRIRTLVASEGAPALTYSTPATPTSPITATAPAGPAGAVAYMVEVQVNGGKRQINGEMVADPTLTRVRIVVVRVGGIRKILPGEREEYEIGGWAHAFNELVVKLLAGGGAVPDPLTVGTINVTNEANISGPLNMVNGDPFDSTGNDQTYLASSHVFTASQAFEANAVDAVILKASGGYVSVACGVPVATGLAVGTYQVDASGTLQLVSSAGEFYGEGATLATLFGGTFARFGVTSTSGVVQVGTADGDGELPASITIGGSPGSGTHAANYYGRVVQVRGSLSASLDAPTVAIGGTYATGTIEIGNGSLTTINLVATGLYHNGVPITGGAGDEITDGTGTFGLDGSGNLTTSGAASVAIEASGILQCLGGGGFGLHADLTQSYLDHDTLAALQAPLCSVGTDGGARCDVDNDGTSCRLRMRDAAGNLALTILADDAASSITAAGPLTVAAPAIVHAMPAASAVSSETRTVSGYAGRQETRYYYGQSTSASLLAIAGAFTPSLDNCVLRMRTEVVAIKSDGSGAYGGTLIATFKRVAGTLTIVGTNAEVNVQESTPNTGCYHDVSSGTVRLVVAGIAAETWRWSGYSTVSYEVM